MIGGNFNKQTYVFKRMMPPGLKGLWHKNKNHRKDLSSSRLTDLLTHDYVVSFLATLLPEAFFSAGERNDTPILIFFFFQQLHLNYTQI